MGSSEYDDSLMYAPLPESKEQRDKEPDSIAPPPHAPEPRYPARQRGPPVRFCDQFNC